MSTVRTHIQVPNLPTSVWAIGAKAEADARIRAETTAVYFIFLEDG